LTDLNKKVQANDKVVGSYSNASYTISSVDQTTTKVVSIIVTPSPPTANGNGPYGFEETFVEWPDTLS
jgi:phosphosulfolactate phosphohydrolase-like enzyme